MTMTIYMLPQRLQNWTTFSNSRNTTGALLKLDSDFFFFIIETKLVFIFVRIQHLESIMTIIRTTNKVEDRDDAVNKLLCWLCFNDMTKHTISRVYQLRIMALAHGMRTTKVFAIHLARLAWIINFEWPWRNLTPSDEASSFRR